MSTETMILPGGIYSSCQCADHSQYSFHKLQIMYIIFSIDPCFYGVVLCEVFALLKQHFTINNNPQSVFFLYLASASPYNQLKFT